MERMGDRQSVCCADCGKDEADQNCGDPVGPDRRDGRDKVGDRSRLRRVDREELSDRIHERNERGGDNPQKRIQEALQKAL